MTLDYGFFGSLNFFKSLNGLRGAGKYIYNEEAIAELSPRVREDLLREYYHGLGLSEKNAFHQHLAQHFQAQQKAFDEILDRYPLTEEQKNSLKQQLKTQQKPIADSAIAFDKNVPGKAPTAVHPGDFQLAARQEKNRLLKEVQQFSLTPLLTQLKDMVEGPKPPPKTKTIERMVKKKVKKEKDKTELPPTVPPPPPPPTEHSAVELAFFADGVLGGELQARNRIDMVQAIIELETKLATPEETAGEHAKFQFQRADLEARYKTELESAFRDKYGKRFQDELSTTLKIKVSDPRNPPPELTAALDRKINDLIQERFDKQKRLVTEKRAELVGGKTRLDEREINELGTEEVRLATLEKERYEDWLAAQKKELEKAKKRTLAANAAEARAADTGEVKEPSPPVPEEDEYEEEEVLETEEVPDDSIDTTTGATDFDLDKIKAELEDAQKKSKKTLEDQLNKAVTALHQAAQRERDLIGWLLASEVAQKRLSQQAFFSTTPTDYTVMMTGGVQDKVKKLHEAIQEQSVEKISQAGGIHAPSGLDIAVGKNEKGQLTFSVQFPPLFMKRSFYTDPRHNTQATLLFQAALVRNTGAETIVTDISHPNQNMAMQLAREAFIAARKVGFAPDEITIHVNGNPIKRQELFEETLTDVQYPGQQPPKVNVDIAEDLADMDKRIQAELEPDAQESHHAQSRMKEILNQGRAELGLEDRPETTAGPAPGG